jgi:hypothetical protein
MNSDQLAIINERKTKKQMKFMILNETLYANYQPVENTIATD